MTKRDKADYTIELCPTDAPGMWRYTVFCWDPAAPVTKEDERVDKLIEDGVCEGYSFAANAANAALIKDYLKHGGSERL